MGAVLLKDYIEHLQIRKEYFREQRSLEDNPVAKMHNAKMQLNYKRIQSKIDSAKEYYILMGGMI